MTQFAFAFPRELIVDLFAGGGGASLGIEQAFGRPVDVCVNHDADAVAMHAANHPHTEHLRADVFEVNPLQATGGRQVGLLWASPDCKHFSKAKGGKPRSKKIRSLAWVVVKWATIVRPRVIMLENVEEFVTWGPLQANGQPCPKRKGQTFRRWVAQLRKLGYAVEWRELRACDYGVPTIRKRFFLIARCDRLPIRWPQPTHGKPDSPEVRAGKRQPWRTAAECIDFTLPTPSIFLTREQGRALGVPRPLADNTMRRIAKGMRKFVIEAPQPFIVPLRGTHGHTSTHDVAAPLSTVSAQGTHHALVTPFLTEHANASRAASWASNEPLRTQCAEVKGGHFALCAAFLAKHYGGNESPGWPLDRPISALTTQDHHHLVRAFLVKFYGEGGQWQDCADPMHTIPTRDRMGLVTVEGEDYAIADIGMRMLAPRELFRASGFPESYIIDRGADGRKLSKAAQVRMCGNAVNPQLACALAGVNVGELLRAEAVAA
jgi:DNA (cytosine-5)-methyltransferase 1